MTVEGGVGQPIKRKEDVRFIRGEGNYVDDVEWVDPQFQVKGVPDKAKTMQDVASAAYTNLPQGMEGGLGAVSYYDPPNITYPFGSYIGVVDIDKETGEVTIRRFGAVDDAGTIINPMTVDGQIHGGLTMGFAAAMLEEINYDEGGNIQGGSFMDYLLPTAVEKPLWELDKTVTSSPHHPIGAKGVGESPTVGAPAAIANAVVDALAHLGVTNIDIPITPWKVWNVLHEKGVS
jgi:carbon-monoxide dehydrogenase large subunit